MGMATRSLTTEAGYINPKRQKVLRRVAWMDAGRDGQYVYHLQCQRPGCLFEYGSDGISIHQRKCPRCDDGKAGLPVPPQTVGLFG